MTWIAVAIAGGAIVGGVASMSAANKQSAAANNASQMSMQQYQQTRSDLAPWMSAGNTALTSLQNLSGMGGNTPLAQPGQDISMQVRKPTRADAEAEALQAHQQKYGRGLNKYSNMANFNQDIDNRFSRMLSEYNQQVQQIGQQQQAGPGANTGLAGATQNAPLLAPFSLADFQESPAYQFNLQQGLDAINKGAAARGNYYAPQTLQDIGRFSQGLASNEFMNAYNMYGQDQSNVWNRLFALQGTGQNAAAQTGAFGANATNIAGQNQIGAGNAQAAGIVGTANAVSGGIGDYFNYRMMQQILNQQPVYGV